MVSDHISIRPRQRVLDPFQSHDQLDAGSRFWEDTEILLAANSKPPKLTPHPQRSELVLPVFRASSTETPRSRPESVTELCFAKKYAFMETAVFRIGQECLTNILAHSGSAIAKLRVSRSDTDFALKCRTRAKEYRQRNGSKWNRLARRVLESEVCEKESVNWEVAWKSVLSASRRNDRRCAHADCGEFPGVGYLRNVNTDAMAGC